MQQNRTIVGSPLTPASLFEMGAFSGFPTPVDWFSPTGDWTSTYRIWTCHGYRESGNDNRGFLRVRRESGKPGGPFDLQIDRRVIHDGANVHLIRAEVNCSNDELASPNEWVLHSQFIGVDGKPRKKLDLAEQVRVDGRVMAITRGGTIRRQQVSDRLTADWCLFEALQRRPFEEGPPRPFDVLEGLSLVRPGHRLSYRGLSTLKTPEIDTHLHWFQQIGTGTWPYEYWLDDRHRLVMAVTNSRAYILDDEAEVTIKQREAGSRRYEQGRLQKGGAAR